MLTIDVRMSESWDEKHEEFVYETFTLELEHSLVSLSKWESKFKKPFLGDGEKTNEEVLDYLKFMILTPVFPPEVFSRLSQQNIDDITDYINEKMTATWFNEMPHHESRKEQITSELIYYWMISCNIPFECQYWHLSRLFTLIKIFDVKNQKPKKQNHSQMIADRRRLNEQRRAQLGSSG